MRLRRRVRLDTRLADQKVNRLENGPRKRRERARRADRMRNEIRTTEGRAYSPALASWIARELGRPATKASDDEIRRLLD